MQGVTMGVPPNEKVELVAYQLKGVSQEFGMSNGWVKYLIDSLNSIYIILIEIIKITNMKLMLAWHICLVI